MVLKEKIDMNARLRDSFFFIDFVFGLLYFPFTGNIGWDLQYREVFFILG